MRCDTANAHLLCNIDNKIAVSLEILGLQLFSLPGDEGIEPPPKVLETPIIPLDQSPMCLNHTRYLYHIIYRFVKCQIMLALDFF